MKVLNIVERRKLVKNAVNEGFTLVIDTFLLVLCQFSCRLEKWRISTSGELKYLSKFSNLDGSILVCYKGVQVLGYVLKAGC